MSVMRQHVAPPDAPAVMLHNVSRAFRKQRDLERSLPQRLLWLLTRQHPPLDEFFPLKDVSLRINPGDFLGVIGPNGAGKSTLLKLVTGIIPPTTGDLTVNGRVCSLLELGAGFHPDLTGRENIYLNGSIYGMNRREIDSRIERIVDFAELGDFIDTPVKHYSSGMYVRLGFAVAIHTDPDILLVDEVLAVGDVNFQQKCLRSIEHFRERGGTLLLVSHDLATIQSVCTRAIWLEHGTIHADGDPLDVGMAYLESMAHREGLQASTDAADGASRRWGTGRVRIQHVELLNDTGHACEYFITGAAMTVRLHYVAAESVTGPVFGIALHHQNGTHLAGPNTAFAGLDIGVVTGDGYIDYVIPALPLLDGSYTLTAAVVNQSDTETFDYRDRVCEFRVITGRAADRYGMVTLGGAWRTPAAARVVQPERTAV